MVSGGVRREIKPGRIPQFSQVSHSTPQLKAAVNCIAPEVQQLAAVPNIIITEISFEVLMGYGIK